MDPTHLGRRYYAVRTTLHHFKKAAILWSSAAGQREALVYSFGNLLAPLAGLIGSFVAAKCLGPAELGTVQSIMLIPAYLCFLHLGVFNGLSRNIAYYSGK